MNKLRGIQKAAVLLWAIAVTSMLSGPLRAQVPPGATNTSFLGSWSFNDTNAWTSDQGYAPVSFTNLGVSYFGQYTAAVVDSTNAAWLRYNVVETNGATNVTVDNGTVMFWFAPAWSSTNEGGTGPGEWGRLLEVGSRSTNDTYGWWCLYVDPDGVNLYFAAQTNGADPITFLSMPIDWTTNRWHCVALTYSATNTVLCWDATNVATGPALTAWPGPDAISNGFGIGSDVNGLQQAHGIFDQLYTFNSPASSNTIAEDYFNNSFWYYANPLNAANFSSAISIPQLTPTFNAVTGQGYLIPISTNTANCVVSSSVWITNAVAKLTNGAMSLTFTIAGGSNGVAYDVFANSVLDF